MHSIPVLCRFPLFRATPAAAGGIGCFRACRIAHCDPICPGSIFQLKALFRGLPRAEGQISSSGVGGRGSAPSPRTSTARGPRPAPGAPGSTSRCGSWWPLRRGGGCCTPSPRSGGRGHHVRSVPNPPRFPRRAGHPFGWHVRGSATSSAYLGRRPELPMPAQLAGASCYGPQALHGLLFRERLRCGGRSGPARLKLCRSRKTRAPYSRSAGVENPISRGAPMREPPGGDPSEQRSGAGGHDPCVCPSLGQVEEARRARAGPEDDKGRSLLRT